jgi:hypothetical protein
MFDFWPAATVWIPQRPRQDVYDGKGLLDCKRSGKSSGRCISSSATTERDTLKRGKVYSWDAGVVDQDDGLVLVVTLSERVQCNC